MPHNIANAGDQPARVIMTVSTPGHEHYVEELARLPSAGELHDAQAIGDLRRRYDTDQLSALQKRDAPRVQVRHWRNANRAAEAVEEGRARQGRLANASNTRSTAPRPWSLQPEISSR